MQVALKLLEKEKLDKSEIVTLLGKRPFVEVSTYEQYLEAKGKTDEKEDEGEQLPPGLRDWNRPAADKDSKDKPKEAQKQDETAEREQTPSAEKSEKQAAKR